MRPDQLTHTARRHARSICSDANREYKTGRLDAISRPVTVLDDSDDEEETVDEDYTQVQMHRDVEPPPPPSSITDRVITDNWVSSWRLPRHTH